MSSYKSRLVALIQFCIVLGLSYVIYISVFFVVGIYAQDNGISHFLLEHQEYLYVLIASIVGGVIYSSIFIGRKKRIQRSLLILHGNIFLYYFLINTLSIGNSAASIIVGTSVIGFFVRISRFRHKASILARLLFGGVCLLLIESIPTYHKTVNLGVFFDQQPTIVSSHAGIPIDSANTNNISNNENSEENSESRSFLLLVHDNEQRRYSIDSIKTDGLRLSQKIDAVQYVSSATNSGSIVSLTLWNGDVVFIYPQTHLSLAQQRDYNTLSDSHTTITVHEGSVGRSSIQNGSIRLIYQDETDEIYMSHSGLLIGGAVAPMTETLSSAHKVLLQGYQSDLREFAREYYTRNLSESPVLERLSYGKMMVYQLLFPEYTGFLRHFAAYRYLVFGDPTNDPQIIYIPLEQVEQTATSQREIVDALETVQSGASIALPRTQLLKGIFESDTD